MATTSTQTLDTSGAAWTQPVPFAIDLNGWNQAAANNYLCQLAGLDPAAQAGYLDRPPGPYDAVNCTEARLTPTDPATLRFTPGQTLAAAYSAVGQTTVQSMDASTMTLTTTHGTY